MTRRIAKKQGVQILTARISGNERSHRTANTVVVLKVLRKLAGGIEGSLKGHSRRRSGQCVRLHQGRGAAWPLRIARLGRLIR
ncbi:hypothetical protein CAP37_01380 [Hydrogenophaga sp. IBVHS1]|nr:hypothetical protein CAP37_01380 [Hydrogenophaga sp. IBVHS1]